jgi:hypothetical protein
MNFKEFLIKYTKLDINFIEDFYTTITGAYIRRYEEYLIDSEVLRKWLKIEDKQLYENIINDNLESEVHYKVILEGSKIMLSRDGARLVCELSDVADKDIIMNSLVSIEEMFLEFFFDSESDLSDYPDPDLEA